jgi:hypothetical protein
MWSSVDIRIQEGKVTISLRSCSAWWTIYCGVCCFGWSTKTQAILLCMGPWNGPFIILVLSFTISLLLLSGNKIYPLCPFNVSDWGQSMQPVNIINPLTSPNHLSICLNVLPWCWRWRQHIPLKRLCQSTVLHLAKMQKACVEEKGSVLFRIWLLSLYRQSCSIGQ